MFWQRKKWDVEADVVVLGTGAAGLVAALAARAEGASVVVLEKTDKVGGTTAVSGGVVWVPGNPRQATPDDVEAAIGYVASLTDGRAPRDLVETWVRTAPEMLAFVERATKVRFSALERYPDYHPERPGGRTGGRSLDPGLFCTEALGAWKERLRKSSTFGATAMTIAEATEWGVFAKPLALPFELLAKRLKEGWVCYGAALVGFLLEACIAEGIEPRLDTRADELVVEAGRVVGVRATSGGKPLAVHARRGVILATGGFEWDAELVSRFLGGPLSAPNSPPAMRGDGLRMAMAVGADLGNMTEAWWCPSLVVPGETYDGEQLFRGDFAMRSLPHSIVVNRAGARFVNEAQNYNDLMKPFFAFDPRAYDRPNLPAYVVVDQQFRDRYMFVTLVPGQRTPAWVPTAPTLAELAAKLGVDAAGLEATVARFNDFAREGRDADFGRGASAYDHFYGDPAHAPNPNLGTLEKPPFYALEVQPGALGTKGGPRTDADGRVLHVSGAPIAGLYAAGNVMAGVTGAGYPGAGSTISVGMTWGLRAARHACTKG